MKNLRHILLLATILLLPLSLSAQNKGFQIPSKKQSTTSNNNSGKTKGSKSDTSKKSGGNTSGKNNSSKNNNNLTKNENSNTTQHKGQQREEQERQAYEQRLREEQEQKQREAEEPKKQNQRIIQNLIDNMVYVEGGTFIMGATLEQRRDAFADEKPAHEVSLMSFSIGKYEVTQAEWEAVMGSNPSQFTGNSECPVEYVNWDDCQEFIRKLNAMTGKHFRLPTEAEWEYAARGGNRSHGYKYSGSDTLNDISWFGGNSAYRTHPVGGKTPNELGLYDMSGNVWEWCLDGKREYSGRAQSNPIGSGNLYVIRGGAWKDKARYCRVSNRFCPFLSGRNEYIGLRLAL